MTDHITDHNTVKAKELEDIAARRQAVKLGARAGANRQPEPDAANLVGLALSGGGIRSASFNLGVLQAFYRAGLIRYVDYLATVSGGGFTGAHFSAQVRRLSEPINPNNLSELLPQENGRQPEGVQRLIRGGSYLNRSTFLLANYWLIGFLLTNLVVFSGVLAYCALIAWLWRMLDEYPIAEQLLLWSDGRLTEAWRPFLPFCFFAAVWLLAWLVSWVIALARPFAQRPSAVTKFLLFFTVLPALLVGITVWLATPEINLQRTGSEEKISFAQRHRDLYWPLLAVIVTALIPFLKPKSLLQSGTQPRGALRPFIFHVAMSALVGGIPLVLIFDLARRDAASSVLLSFAVDGARDERGYPLDGIAARSPALHQTDIYNNKWPTFWRQVQRQKDDTSLPGGAIWKRLSAETREDIDRLIPAIQHGNPQWKNEMRLLAMPLDDDLRQAKQRIINDLNRAVIWEEPEQGRRPGTGPGTGGGTGMGGRRERGGAFFRDVQKSIAPEMLQQRSQQLRDGPALKELWWRAEQGRLLDRDFPRLNRLILEAYYYDEIYERAIPRRTLVTERDQETRERFLLWCLAAFGLSALFVNLNWTSMHRFYRRQLARYYIEGHAAAEVDEEETAPAPGAGDALIRMADLDTTTRGGPYHLVCATLNSFKLLDNRNRTYAYVFSRRYCGARGRGFQPTGDYAGGKLDLASVVAISGAAVSPTQIRTFWILVLMFVGNMRLGQWLPNPGQERAVGWRRVLHWLLDGVRRYPTMMGLLLDAARPSRARRYAFVSDGGHYENLGIEVLLERRCRLIIAADATADSEYSFREFLDMCRRVRLRDGIRILSWNTDPLAEEPINLHLLKPFGDRLAAEHFFVARIHYPEDPNDPAAIRDGYLIYLRASMTGDEENDLRAHFDANPDFPNDPTLNQLFDDVQVQSYRQLGFHIARELCKRMPTELWDEKHAYRVEDLVANWRP